MKRFEVIATGTSCGHQFRIVLKQFRSQEAAAREADRYNRKQGNEGYAHVQKCKEQGQ